MFHARHLDGFGQVNAMIEPSGDSHCRSSLYRLAAVFPSRRSCTLRPLVLALFFFTTSPAFAIYVGTEVEKVPVARLIENLENIVKENPASAEALLNLGRAHGMAYAQKSDPLNVTKAYHGIAPPAVPFGPVMDAADASQKAAAKVHLDAALKDYQQALALDHENLVVRLGLAWLTEQAGQRDDAVKQYRKLAADIWDKEQKLQSTDFDGYSLTGEVASYLLPLLDAEKDKREIEVLKGHVDTLGKLPYPVTPIVVPLADGLSASDLESPNARVAFDVDGSGLGHEWSWITPKAAWLVNDPKHNGKITSGRQLFGTVTFWMFWKNGYGPLAALDDNRDGSLTGKELDGLALWHDADSNGVADAGEVKPLSAYGIVALSSKWQTLTDTKDRIAFSPDGVSFANGRTRPTYDLILNGHRGIHAVMRSQDTSASKPRIGPGSNLPG
jgi:hypothetical protein